ncbi:MAG: hypothetical protein ACI30M_04440 [Muribaculaceae bacterium]
MYLKKLLLLFLISASLEVYASEPLVVDKLINQRFDLSATSVNTPKDLNGVTCGLLKVITTDKSMSFEGSIIGTPEYKNGEYWVYIPQNTYLIRIKSDKHEPLMLNFREYNIERVESKNTYELTFYHMPYETIFMKKHTIISGPKLKKFALVYITLPGDGWIVGGMTTLDYLKRFANVLERDGDSWGCTHQCTILAEKEDDIVYSYKLIIESTDDEDDAILAAAAGYGGGCAVIQIVQN